jgi:RND family efflux transporter MFP subunit
MVGVVVVLLTLGLALWTWQRVAQATTEKKALEGERTRQAAARQAEALKGPQGNTAQVNTVQGVSSPWQPQVKVEGTLGILKEGDVGFMASGRLTTISVRVGDAVKKGQVLARLDDETALAQMKAGEAQVRAVEAQLGMAADNVARTAPLVEKGALPKQADVQARGQEQLMTAQLDAARAQVALTQVMLQQHTLLAPFSGVVTRAPTAPGMVVGAGTPLFHVVDTSQLRLNATVNAEDAALLRVGSPVEVFVQDRILTGKVTAVLPTMDPLTRRVPVEAVVGNEGASPVFAGGLVKATVRSTASVPTLKYPISVRRPGSQDEVMVVNGTQLEARRISYSLADDGALLVRAGLLEQDRVMLNPTAEARAGDAVSVPKVSP